MTAIDDKAIEAARGAYDGLNPFLTRDDHEDALRAALAAADKVRAEGFDFEALGKQVQKFRALELPGQIPMMHMGTAYLVDDLWRACQKAFSAGLAKGEAERAALREALKEARGIILAMGLPDEATDNALARIDAALGANR